jgi:LysR family transcriptional regulator, transcriptional activator for bauABCD operon
VGLFDKTATNPMARLPQALGLFRQQAPQVTLELTVGSLHQLEAAVIDGRMGLAVVPDHRRSDSLSYAPLFPENMYLYAAQGHPLFDTASEADWDTLRRQDYAGLAFHSPNMEVTHRFGLKRTASVNDQEALALLVLSGCYIGFLPDHYAEVFLRQGRLRRLGPADAGYEVQFVAITRATPAPARPVKAFLEVLQAAHGQDSAAPASV